MWGKIGAILMGCLDVCNYFCACDVYNFSLVMRAAMRTVVLYYVFKFIGLHACHAEISTLGYDEGRRRHV